VTHPDATKSGPPLLEWQVDVLELLAQDAALDTVLEEICRMAEALVPGSLAGVTILDRAGIVFERCVMPSAPSFAAGIRGVGVGPPHPGTCAAAVHSGVAVSSADVPSDERFDPAWRRLNAEHGVRCIKSRPVTADDGRPLGSFFIAFTDEPAPPWPDDVEAVCTRLAGFALERHASAERTGLIVGEIQHRLKNIFASVLSIAAQTAQGRATTEEFMKAFEGRVLALATAHDLLSQHDSADLAELVRRVVGPFASADALEVAGRPFKVAPSAVVPFSLVLHELATNAAKYGALSIGGGKARTSWKSYSGENGELRFKFKWEERGGPKVAPPRRSGFGTVLMKRAFADLEGQTRLTHAPEGLRYCVDAPMSGRLGRAAEAPATLSDVAAD